MQKRLHFTALMLITLVMFLHGCKRGSDKPEVFTIGLVTNNPNGMSNVEGFIEAMDGLGYSEGKNVSYLYENAPVSGENLGEHIDGLIEKKVDLIFTAGTPTGVAAHERSADTEVPVIFGVIADPVMAGVVTNLSEPGGNMTGVMLSQNQDRRFELLLEIAPEIRTVFIPFNPDDPAPVGAFGQIKLLASRLGVDLLEGHARSRDEALSLLLSMPDTVDAIFMLPDSTVNPLIDDLVALSIDRRIPMSGPSMIQVEQGALTAYGIIHKNVGAQAARFADQVLKGADPGTLPVENAEFSLGINLQTADAIGLKIPSHIVQQAELIVRTGRQE